MWTWPPTMMQNPTHSNDLAPHQHIWIIPTSWTANTYLWWLARWGWIASYSEQGFQVEGVVWSKASILWLSHIRLTYRFTMRCCILYMWQVALTLTSWNQHFNNLSQAAPSVKQSLTSMTMISAQNQASQSELFNFGVEQIASQTETLSTSASFRLSAIVWL